MSENQVKVVSMSPFYCGNPECGQLLGWSTEDGYILMGGAVLERASFFCSRCGWHKSMRKSDKKLDDLLRKLRWDGQKPIDQTRKI